MINFHESNIKRAIKNVFLKRNINLVVIEPRHGLGDSIIVSGLVNFLSSSNPNKFFYYCVPDSRNFISIRWMFQNLKNVCVISLADGRQARQISGFFNSTYLPLGVRGIDKNIYRLDEYYYECAKVPIEKRWQSVLCPPGPLSSYLYKKLNPREEPYILICANHSNRRDAPIKVKNINSLQLIYVTEESDNIFDWVDLIMHAREIHTVNTSFMHLVESCFAKIDTYSCVFYFHELDRPKCNISQLPWIIVK